MTNSTSSNDDSIWQYSPSTPLTAIVAVLYLVPTTILKYRGWFFLCVLIGSCLKAGGYIARPVSTKNVTEVVRPWTLFH
jgi:hypothetical protein